MKTHLASPDLTEFNERNLVHAQRVSRKEWDPVL